MLATGTAPRTHIHMLVLVLFSKTPQSKAPSTAVIAGPQDIEDRLNLFSGSCGRPFPAIFSDTVISLPLSQADVSCLDTPLVIGLPLNL